MKRKTYIGNYSLMGSVATGAALGLLITLLLVGVAAIFINNEYLRIESNRLIGSLIQFLSAASGGVWGVITAGKKKSLACLGAVSGYYMMLLLTALLLFDGIGGMVITGLACVTAGGVCSILLTNSRQNEGNKRKRRRRTG